MKKLKSKILVGIIGIVMSGFVMSENLDIECDEYLTPYRNNYISDSGERPYSLEQRLVYLNSLPDICKLHDYAIIFKTDVLARMKRYREALDFLDDSISNFKGQRIGNLLYEKASTMLILKKNGFLIEDSYEQLAELLEKALISPNEVELPIYYSLSEAYYQIAMQSEKQEDFEKAMHVTLHAIELKPAARLYSIVAILSHESGQHAITINLIKKSVAEFGKPDYLQQPDTVLALTRALCIENEYEWAKKIVLSAQAQGENFAKLDDIVTAAAIVENPLNCQPQ